jgi:hypothetical protein
MVHVRGDSQSASQEWACKALGVKICIVAGEGRPQVGMQPQAIIPATPVYGADHATSIWIWSHQSVDGAGQSADHFSYICEDGVI